MASKTEKAPKVANPQAPRTGKLPEPAAGCEWDTVEIDGMDFAIQVAKDEKGIVALCKGNSALAARLFNRALRIDVPAKIDGRRILKESKNREESARVLQTEILSFDLTALRPRAARTPKSVIVPDQRTFTNAEVQELLRTQGIMVVASK